MEVATCRCGSAWFELRGRPGTDDLEHGAISVNGRGSVIAYTGELRCVECGESWEPGTDRLRSVD